MSLLIPTIVTGGVKALDYTSREERERKDCGREAIEMLGFDFKSL